MGSALAFPSGSLGLERSRIMGVLNVTPDSFSDGGRFLDRDAAVAQARELVAAGADILDVGGESTRPGAEEVPLQEELDRVVPVIEAIADLGMPISVDTRKAVVMREAVGAGAGMINDVSALLHDPEALATAADLGVPVCLMHMQGTPETMQADPRYDDVVAEVRAYLEGRANRCLEAGIDADNIVLDPGIGFGKTVAHNLALIRGLSLFHGLGCAVLLGVSRKRFIGTVSGEEVAANRGPGSLAVALEGVRQGVHVLRVHDIAETCQAVALWRAVHGLDDRWVDA